MRMLLAVAIVALGTTLVVGAEDTAHSCVVVQELTADRPLLTLGDSCSTTLSPASTYKIPHALIALETGAITLETVEKPDGRQFDRQRKWNQEHTVISALRPSVLWVFQRIAPRIGSERAAEWLARFDYGNRDASGPIAEYWINGRLQISPPQQLAFLRRFFSGALPVRPGFIAAVKEGLRQQTGTVENALGVHALKGEWQGTTLFAKTGATSTADHRVSWLVGLLQVPGHEYVFASAVWKATGTVDALEASHLTAATFADAELLPGRR